MIHISRLPDLMERVDKNKKRVPFSLVFVKKSTGEVLNAKEVVCTSTFAENRTANILFVDSREVRKISMLSIIRFNDEEVFV